MSASFDLPSVLPGIGKIFENQDDDCCFGPELIPGIVKTCFKKAEIEDRCLKCHKIYTDNRIKQVKEAEKERKKQVKEAENAEKKSKKKISVYDMKMEIIHHSLEYQEHKKVFEAKFIKIAGEFRVKTPEGTLEPWTKRSVEDDILSRKNFKFDPEGINKDFRFFDLYLEDEIKKDYISSCFHPTGYKAGFDTSNYYNEWEGFKQDKYYNNYIDKISNELNESGIYEGKDDNEKFVIFINRVKKDCEIILNHIKIIVGNDPEKKGEDCDSYVWFVKVLSWIVKFPGNPISNVITLLKDCAGLIESGGGTGKTKWFYWFFEYVIGDNLTITTTDNKDIYNKFNSLFDKKLFCLIEEASGGENHQNSGQLKGMITSKRRKIENKGKDAKDKPTFINYFATTNESNAIPVDRRVAVFSPIKKYRCDVNYFNTLDEAMNNPITATAFYAFLKLIPTFESPAEAENTIPKVEARNEMIRVQADPVKKWLANIDVLNYLKEARSSTDLYYNFKTVMLQLGEAKSEASIMSHTKFGLKIMSKEAESIFAKDRTNSGIKYKANIPEIIKVLKKQEILPEDFELEYKEVQKVELPKI